MMFLFIQAMKGFLVTQQEAVENVVVAARRLRGDAAFDQQEVQETIETVEERWSELVTKVDEYEAWLESSVQACKQYDASIGYIRNVLNDTEERLGTSAAGNIQELKTQVEQLRVGHLCSLKFSFIYYISLENQYQLIANSGLIPQLSTLSCYKKMA